MKTLGIIVSEQRKKISKQKGFWRENSNFSAPALVIQSLSMYGLLIQGEPWQT